MPRMTAEQSSEVEAPSEEQLGAEFLKMYNSGKSMKDIATATGNSLHTVKTLLHAQPNFQVRSRAEQTALVRRRWNNRLWREKW